MVTEFKAICVFCGRPAECTHHLVFGMGMRELADADSLTVPACNKCHNMGELKMRVHDNPMAEKMSKMIGQLAWEKEWVLKHTDYSLKQEAREAFRKRYGKSYL